MSVRPRAYRFPLGLRVGRWVSAEPATLRTGFGVLGLRSNLLAIEPTAREVCSFLGMPITSFLLGRTHSACVDGDGFL
jgi:hypothetical protein